MAATTTFPNLRANACLLWAAIWFAKRANTDQAPTIAPGACRFSPWLSSPAMSGEVPEASEASDEVTESGAGAGQTSQRARLAVALGAAFLLAAIVGVVVATGGSGDEQAAAPTGTCFEAWNTSGAPIQDGQHAYTAHGYRQTLVTRLDSESEIIGSADDEAAPNDPEARCVVIFATPQPDFEPDFGVRVLVNNRWTGLVVAEKVPLDDIAALQAQAVPESNALLAANGTLVTD